MSIDWLMDLERYVECGKPLYACPGVMRNQWVFRKSIEELLVFARRAANNTMLPVHLVKVLPHDDTLLGNFYLVPVAIGEPGTRGEPDIKWATVESREAAEIMRDVRHGPSPFFGTEVVDTVSGGEPRS
jgi:hypothetical protein